MAPYVKVSRLLQLDDDLQAGLGHPGDLWLAHCHPASSTVLDCTELYHTIQQTGDMLLSLPAANSPPPPPLPWTRPQPTSLSLKRPLPSSLPSSVPSSLHWIQPLPTSLTTHHRLDRLPKPKLVAWMASNCLTKSEVR